MEYFFNNGVIWRDKRRIFGWCKRRRGEGHGVFLSHLVLSHSPASARRHFSDAGPDTRWVGNEFGLGASTCSSIYNSTLTPIGGIYNDPRYAAEGDPAGHEWVPALCDVSIRPGWFWHPLELLKSAINLLEIYYKSVGRNCHLLLNVPPNSSGLISPEDIQVLQEFTELRRSIFSNNFAINALLQASSTRGEGGGGGGGGTCDSQFSSGGNTFTPNTANISGRGFSVAPSSPFSTPAESTMFPNSTSKQPSFGFNDLSSTPMFQTTPNVQSPSMSQGENVSTDLSIWLKEKWNPGEIPEEAPPDSVVR